jgi:hypothetical protein
MCFKDSPLIEEGLMSKVAALIKVIEDDFRRRHPGHHKSQREGSSALAGGYAGCGQHQSDGIGRQAARAIAAAEHRYQYIERQLKNKAVVPNTVTKPAFEVIERLAASGQTIVLQMDQSRINVPNEINDPNEVLMLSVRLRKRALPVA